MRNEITLTITNGTYKNLNKIRKDLGWSGAIGLLILCTDMRSFKKIMRAKPVNKQKKEDREYGRTSLKISLNLHKILFELSKEKSMSIALDVLIEIYDKKKFKEYMIIKSAGR